MLKTLTQRNDRGFTLIELLVVIAIIAVLAALILAALSSAQKGSRDSRRKSDLNQYKTALAQYAGDNNGNYPTQATATGMTNANAPYSALTGTYMTNFIDDPKTAGNYSYVAPSGSASGFGICAPLERNTSNMFAVGPTYSGEKANATCTAQG